MWPSCEQDWVGSTESVSSKIKPDSITSDVAETSLIYGLSNISQEMVQHGTSELEQ